MSSKVAIECPVDYQYEEVTAPTDYQYEEVDYQYEDYYGYGDGTPDQVDPKARQASGNNNAHQEEQPDYGYGSTEPDYGYGSTETDYGYGSTEPDGRPAAVDAADPYGYGDDAGGGSSQAPPPRQQQTRRRNSCVIRRDQEKGSLAVAEFLMGGPPRMSDKDLAVEHRDFGTITT